MATIRRCRSCHAPKWGADPCSNADCTRASAAPTPLRAKTRPVTAAVKHGYHAGVATLQLVSDYDSPIRARSWRSA
jgi:hypothetical protein